MCICYCLSFTLATIGGGDVVEKFESGGTAPIFPPFVASNETDCRQSHATPMSSDIIAATSVRAASVWRLLYSCCARHLPRQWGFTLAIDVILVVARCTRAGGRWGKDPISPYDSSKMVTLWRLRHEDFDTLNITSKKTCIVMISYTTWRRSIWSKDIVRHIERISYRMTSPVWIKFSWYGDKCYQNLHRRTTWWLGNDKNNDEMPSLTNC